MRGPRLPDGCANRIGRKTPLMIAILGYSLCNLAAGFSPTFTFLLSRAPSLVLLHGRGMAGRMLAHGEWKPGRSAHAGYRRGPSGSWGIGFMMSFAIYGLFYNTIGWRGMLWWACCRPSRSSTCATFVKEPEVGWKTGGSSEPSREVKAPLISIFKRGMILNTLERLLVHGKRLRPLLFDHRAVRERIFRSI